MSEWVSILHVTSVHVSALEGVKNFTKPTKPTEKPILGVGLTGSPMMMRKMLIMLTMTAGDERIANASDGGLSSPWLSPLARPPRDTWICLAREVNNCLHLVSPAGLANSPNTKSLEPTKRLAVMDLNITCILLLETPCLLVRPSVTFFTPSNANAHPSNV